MKKSFITSEQDEITHPQAFQSGAKYWYTVRLLRLSSKLMNHRNEKLKSHIYLVKVHHVIHIYVD